MRNYLNILVIYLLKKNKCSDIIVVRRLRCYPNASKYGIIQNVIYTVLRMKDAE